MDTTDYLKCHCRARWIVERVEQPEVESYLDATDNLYHWHESGARIYHLTCANGHKKRRSSQFSCTGCKIAKEKASEPVDDDKRREFIAQIRQSLL